MTRQILPPVILLALAGFFISCDLSNAEDELKAPFPCENGMAKEFSCENVDLFAHLSIYELSVM